MFLTALQFSSYLSWLTLLTGESWRVRYVLIQCFTILQRAASDDRIRKNVRPAGTSSRPDGPTSSPLTFARSRCEREQASPGNAEDVWPGRAGPDNPSTALPPLQPSLQTASQGLCTAVQYPWTHQLASGAHNMSRGSIKTTFFVLGATVGLNLWLNVPASYWRDFVQSLKKNHSYKQLIRATH